MPSIDSAHVSSKGCCKAFILFVLVHALNYVQRIATENHRIRYPFSALIVLDWLKLAKTDCERLSSEEMLTYFLGGNSLFCAHDNSTYWTKPQQFFTWWKNNVERVHKLTQLVLDSAPYYLYFPCSDSINSNVSTSATASCSSPGTLMCPSQPPQLRSGDDLATLQRAYFCKAAVALSLRIKKHFYSVPEKFFCKYAPFAHLLTNGGAPNSREGIHQQFVTSRLGEQDGTKKGDDGVGGSLVTFAPALALKVQPAFPFTKKRKLADTTADANGPKPRRLAGGDIFEIPTLVLARTLAVPTPLSPMAAVAARVAISYSVFGSAPIISGRGVDTVLRAIQACNAHVAEAYPQHSSHGHGHSRPSTSSSKVHTACSSGSWVTADYTSMTNTSSNSSSSRQPDLPLMKLSASAQALFGNQYYQQQGRGGAPTKG